MEATNMSDQNMTWQEIGETIIGNPLTPKAELLKVELCNFMRKGNYSDLADTDIAILLLVIGESLLERGHL